MLLSQMPGLKYCSICIYMKTLAYKHMYMYTACVSCKLHVHIYGIPVVVTYMHIHYTCIYLVTAAVAASFAKPEGCGGVMQGWMMYRYVHVLSTHMRCMYTRFWIHFNMYQSIPRPGRPTKLTERVKNIVDVEMQGNDETTAKELASTLSRAGYQMSLRTVLKCRKALGWTHRGAAYCQLIRAQNKEKRLLWACQYLQDEFTGVVWTDETTVQLETHRRFCCRKRGQKPRYKTTP